MYIIFTQCMPLKFNKEIAYMNSGKVIEYLTSMFNTTIFIDTLKEYY